MRLTTACRVMAAAALGVGSVHAQEMFIYPSKGQTAAQQDKDKYECYGWAKSQTGFDPMAPPTTRTPPPAGGSKSVAGGAVKGAVVGAGVGAVAGARFFQIKSICPCLLLVSSGFRLSELWTASNRRGSVPGVTTRLREG